MKIKSLLLGLAVGIATMVTCTVQAQVSPVIVPLYTNACLTFSTNTSASTPTNPDGFAVIPGGNVTIFATVSSTNAGAATEYFGFQSSLDYTNWTSLATYTGTMTLRGSNLASTAAFTFTNVQANYLRWYSFGNSQTGAVVISTLQGLITKDTSTGN